MTTDGLTIMDGAALRADFDRLGQGHVFAFWETLGPESRARLLAQAASFDLPALLHAQEAALANVSTAPPKLEPISVISRPAGDDTPEFARARETGESLLRAGRVAIFVVAGGQATRLGYPGPKGCFPLGPVSERSLFHIQAEKIRGLRRRYGARVPWYVMTSPATDGPTRDFFAAHDSFGMPTDDVVFLCQRMVPSFDFEGRLMLDQPDHIFMNPDGHGGSLTALLHSGALDDMDSRGIDTVFYYQVDNPLIQMADPVFLGFHAERSAQISTKVVRKQHPDDKVGVVAIVDGKPGVVEYTEIQDAARSARDDAGELIYWTGNVAIHAFDTAFLRTVSAQADACLPYHASAKAIPTVDSNGVSVVPDAPNGHKLERFVFDALRVAERTVVLETLRKHEYSPVKNRSGIESPETSRRDLVACYHQWLAEAQIEVPPGATLEIDHSSIDGPDDAKLLGIASASEAPDKIRIDTGEPA